MSFAELDYAIPADSTTISEQLDTPVETGVLDLYDYEQNENEPGLPTEFYGPSERGIEILYEFKYLRGVPVLRALYRNTKKSTVVERHENASRPELPEAVREALSMGEDSEGTNQLAEN